MKTIFELLSYPITIASYVDCDGLQNLRIFEETYADDLFSDSHLHVEFEFESITDAYRCRNKLVYTEQYTTTGKCSVEYTIAELLNEFVNQN